MFVTSLVIDPTNHLILYAATYGGGVFKTTNGGTSWTAVSNGLANMWASALAIDPVKPFDGICGHRTRQGLQDHERRDELVCGECGVHGPTERSRPSPSIPPTT